MPTKKPKNADELAKILAKENLADEEFLSKTVAKMDKLENSLDKKTEVLKKGVDKMEKDLDADEDVAVQKLDELNIKFADDLTKDDNESEEV